MAVSGRTRWILFLLVVLFAGAGVGLPLLERIREKEILQYIEEIPGTLKAEQVSVSLLANRVEIAGLSGRVRVFEEDPLDLSIEVLTLDGLNRNAAAGIGESRLAERIRAKNMRLEAPGESRILMGYGSILVAEYALGGLSADYRLFSRAASGRTLGEDFVKAALSLRFGPWVVTDITCVFRGIPGMEEVFAAHPELGGQSSTLRIGHTQADGHSLIKTGKMLCTDIEHTSADGTVMRTKSASMDGMALPAAVLRISLLGAGEMMKNPASALNVFAEGFSYKNLNAAETLFSMPDGGTVTIPACSLNVAIGGGMLDVRARADDILIAPESVLTLFPEWKPALDALGSAPLRFYLDLNLDFQRDKAGAARLVFDGKGGEKRLGDLDVSFTLNGRALDGPGVLLPLDISGAALSEARIEMHDRNFLHAAFFVPGWMDAPDNNPADTPEAARARRDVLVRKIEEEAASLPQTRRPLLEAYARWVADSGVLRVAIEPKTPFSLFNTLLFHDAGLFDELGVQVMHIPPEKPEES